MSGGVPLASTVAALGTIPAQNFDPQVTSTFSIDQRSIPVNNPITAGTGGSSCGRNFFLFEDTHCDWRPDL